MILGLPPRLPRAACRTPEGVELFLDEGGSTVAACKAICAGCPEREACLAWALVQESTWGVWAGYTASELGRMRAKTAPALAPAPRRTFTAANTARLNRQPQPEPEPEPVAVPAAIDDGPGTPAWNALATSPRVRTWARADGWQIPPGRLPGAIVAAYRTAHPGETP